MLFTFGIITTSAVAAVFIVANSLRSAPEAYEDELGFHIIRKPVKGSGILLRRKPAVETEAASLKGARVNP